MPVETTVISTKFYNQFKNDTSFGSNLSDFTPNLVGSVMEKIKLVQQIDIEWYAEATPTDEWAVTTTSIKRVTGNFITDGFAIGDKFQFISAWSTSRTAPVEVTADITAISNNGKQLTISIGSGSFAQSTYTDAGIRGISELRSLIYKFGLIDNKETFNTISKVSQNDQAYYSLSDIGSGPGGGGRSTSFVSMASKGSYNDWVTGSAQVRFVSEPTALVVQRFEIEHEFTIVPWYLEGELFNLENRVLPEILAGDATLKYVYQPEFRTAISNPNTSKIVTIDNNLGSVAWFDENFNGFDNNYEILSVDYEEEATTNSSDGLLVSSKTKATITVQKNNGVFPAGQRAGVYVSYLPPESDYIDTISTDLTENFIYDNALGTAGASGFIGNDFITDLSIAVPVGNTMVITVETLYSNAQQIRLANATEPKFVIGVQLGDNSLSTALQDKVVLIADVNDYDLSPDIPGLMNVTQFDIFTHERDIGIDSGSNDAELWNEDGIVVDFRFNLNLNKDAFLNTLDFVVMAYNSTDERFFDLDSYSFQVANTTLAPTPLPAQQFNINADRGYKLKTGSQFNIVELLTGAQAAGQQFYTGEIGQKVPWQDWISNPNADTVFFNTNDPNDNLNFKSSNYSEINNYSIVFGLRANLTGTSVLGVSGETDYFFLSPTIIVYDYDLDGNITAIWTGVVETFNNDNLTPIGTAVLTGQDTLMRITWTNSGGAVASLGNIWAIHRIEETDQAGFNIDELSTLRPVPDNNRVIPKGTDTQLDMFLDTGNVVTECLIDGSLIEAGKSYNLSGRIGNPDSIINPNAKRTSPDDSVKDLSGSAETKDIAP